MKCPQCGKDDPKAVRFCTSCGARLPAQPTVPQSAPPPNAGAQPTTAMPAAAAPPTVAMTPPVQGAPQAPAAPVAPIYPATQAAKKKMKGSTKAWIVVACVLGALIIAAAIVIPIVLLSANKPAAQINSLKLLRSDGDTLDPDKVPLDKELVLKVNYNARFKSSGSGTLRLIASDSEGENVVDKTYDVTSSDNAQTKEHKFTMTQGSGKPLTAKAELTISQGADKADARKTLSFTVVKGKGAEVQLKEATEAATKKCQEATAALKSASAQGVDITDLADRLSKALDDLKAAKTAEQANAVAGTAQGVIDESNARVTAAKQKQETAAVCRTNQSTIRAKLVDWWGGTGTFPNSLSELYGIPSCPSGGVYTYFAPDTTPATLHVSCSVHGEL